MSAVPQKPARVTLSGDINGHYVVRQRRRGGQLVLDPDVSAEEIRKEVGARKATSEEFARFVSEHEGELAPADDEG
jgi:hypothetical protein